MTALPKGIGTGIGILLLAKFLKDYHDGKLDSLSKWELASYITAAILARRFGPRLAQTLVGARGTAPEGVGVNPNDSNSEPRPISAATGKYPVEVVIKEMPAETSPGTWKMSIVVSVDGLKINIYGDEMFIDESDNSFCVKGMDVSPERAPGEVTEGRYGPTVFKSFLKQIARSFGCDNFKYTPGPQHDMPAKDVPWRVIPVNGSSD